MMYVYSFYKFQKLDSLSKLREEIYNCLSKYSIKGTVLLSHEGINVNMSQRKYLLDFAIKDISKIINLTKVLINKSKTEEIAFKKLRLR
jgi:predicted sulfurtransferase